MNLIRWFLNREDAITQAYHDGLMDGLDIYEKAFLLDRFRSAEASYPDEDYPNVVSLSRHKSYLPPRGAA